MVAHPFVYEINTWVWLDELSRREDAPVDLGRVPEREWEAIAALGFDAVWLMGVWERSPAGIAIALENDELVESFRRALASDPSFADAHFNLAMTLQELGQVDEARQHWEAYLKLDPESKWAEIARRHLRSRA